MPDKEKYLKIIVFSFFIISIFYFSINFVFSGESPIYDDCPSCFDREPPEPGTTTTTTTTSTTTTAPFCGDGTVNNAEQCELPNTNNNIYCPQTTSTCLGNQTGTRDNKGNCNSTCQCMQDPFTYSCVKDSCGAVCSVNADCPNKCVGDARYFSGACDAGCFCSYQSEECTGDGWYDTSGWTCNGDCQRCKQQEYRNYYCEPSGCTHSVTDTRQLCEQSPAGKHCSGGSFITTGYCGSSSPYCSNGCKYKIDRLECSASGTCNQFDYSDTFNCPADTVCSGGSCVNDLSCNTGDYQCKDQCSKAKPQYRCNGFGSCSSFWKWIDVSSCNPFSCSAGSCNGCEKDCGAECESNADCQNFCFADIRYYNGLCSGNCQCSFTSEDCNVNDGWYDTGSFTCSGDCQRCKPQQYRDYYCLASGCTYSITGTRNYCESAPAGQHCSNNQFTTVGYCGSSAAYCSGSCGIGVDKFECGASGVCNYLDYTETTFCPSGTACLSGQCKSDIECGFSNLLCKDDCTVAQQKLRCNSFGSCSQLWQWISITNCNPFFCSSGSCTNICNKDCGAGCESNSDCKDFCLENILHSNGACGSNCECSYTAVDCDSLDGWHDSNSKRYIVCADNPCQECEQRTQDYYDYYCSGSACKYKITDHRWIDTGNRRDKICRWDEICVDGECVPRSCDGDINLEIKKAVDPPQVFTLCPRDRIRATASGSLSFCKGLQVEFREGSCNGLLFGTCKLSSKNECSESIRFVNIGDYVLFACLDKNKDGDFDDAGEQTTANIDVDCSNCLFSRCPSTAGCQRCKECGGAKNAFVNQFHDNVCINPGQQCSYGCEQGYCKYQYCA